MLKMKELLKSETVKKLNEILVLGVSCKIRLQYSAFLNNRGITNLQC